MYHRRWQQLRRTAQERRAHEALRRERARTERTQQVAIAHLHLR